MPIQAPQWTDYLNCPVCCREFGAPPRSPVSLGCGHTLCRHCLRHLHKRQCPFDQTIIQVESEDLVVNTALLQLAGYAPPPQPYHPPRIQALPERDRQAYDVIVQCMEHLAVYLKYCGNANNNISGGRLSRPMQRKLVTLVQCAITDDESRGRAARAARSLGERTVTELIVQQQNPQQLSANLWAAVRARGCQFLGPAMQEEVLKLVLLALEDGSALSRKVLVMFVVQRLEPHFPQASKTSIGHVVQLLYRASCFKVSKRECDSSLMQLKEEFRTYESLRREHDAQIVQIATEAGLRIAPDQWSALLYGDTAHKSHMQSIIDKLQTPQSFAQSVQELFFLLQRTGTPSELVVLTRHLDRLASIDPNSDASNPSWHELAEIMMSLKEVVSRLIHYLQQQATGRDSNHNQQHTLQDRSMEPSTSQLSPQTAASTPTHNKYKVSMCRDAAVRSFCPRGNTCTFAHSEEELERYRARPMNNLPAANGNFSLVPPSPATSIQLPHTMQMPTNIPLPLIYQRLPAPRVPAPNIRPPGNMYPVPHLSGITMSVPPQPDLNQGHVQANACQDPMADHHININQNDVPMSVSEAAYYAMPEEPIAPSFNYPRPDYPMYQAVPSTSYRQDPNLVPSMQNMFINQNETMRNVAPFPFNELSTSDILMDFNIPFPPTHYDQQPVGTWGLDNMYNVMPEMPFGGVDMTTSPPTVPVEPYMDNMFKTSPEMQYINTDGPILPGTSTEDSAMDDEELVEELLALERRIDTEFKSD